MTLLPDLEDLDLFILEDRGGTCDPFACFAHGDEFVIFDAVAGTTYYIVVDGYEGAEDAYEIFLDCL